MRFSIPIDTIHLFRKSLDNLIEIYAILVEFSYRNLYRLHETGFQLDLKKFSMRNIFYVRRAKSRDSNARNIVNDRTRNLLFSDAIPCISREHFLACHRRE